MLKKLVSDYSTLKDVVAIVLGGSSSAKTDDNSSDYDIYIYCTQEPDIEKRREIALKYSDTPEIDNHYFETGDTYILKETGKPIDIMYRTRSSIEAQIDWVWIKHNASMGYTTCFVDNVNKSEILYDLKNWFKNLQDKTKTPFPEELQKNIILKNFKFLKGVLFSYYDQIEAAVKREDFVSINHRSAAFLASYFDIIFALNKIMNPGEKKLVKFALNNCKILPEDFETDVNTLAFGNINQRLKTAEKMVDSLLKIKLISDFTKFI